MKLACQNIRNLFFIVAIGFAVAGCASAKKSGFITDFERMPRGEHVDRFRSNPQLLTRDALAHVYVAEVDTSSVKDAPKVNSKELAGFLRQAVNHALKQKGFTPEGDRGAVTSELQLAISELNPGDATARIIAAELGAGHAKVQCDGKLVSKSGAEIAAFVDRRNSSGAIGFSDVGGDAGPKLMEDLLRKIAIKAVDDLRSEVGRLTRF